ncbi:Dihydroxyacetone ABC transport system, substrate-binding protein, partial [hydrothermal vent metagenome]
SMDIFKQDELFREGKVAYMINWIGFAESSINPKTSKVSDVVDFAMAAGLKKADGTIDRSYNIGGQPFVLMTWNDDTVNKEALEFVKWWLSKETQIAFAKAGGQSGIMEVYEDDAYKTYRPWNHAFAASLPWQKDIWHIPEFFELLVQQQEEFDKAITGQQDAKTTLDAVAKFQEKLLMESGLIQ